MNGILMRLTPLVLTLLVCSHDSFAQMGWFFQNPIPQGNTTLTGVCFTDANTGTAVGVMGTVLRTTDGGTKWTGQPSGTQEQLNEVSFTDANTGTAICFDAILRTSDGGANWESHNIGTTGSLYAVSFTDADTGTVVGGRSVNLGDWDWHTESIILRTTNSGETWTNQWSGFGPSLRGICFTDVNTGTAVGDSSTILRTTDGGTTWSRQSSGTSNVLDDVSFVDTNTGTVVGWFGVILRTTNGGAVWINQASGTSMSLYGVSFTDANTGTAVGLAGTILRTTNGGGNWISQPSGTNAALQDVWFTDPCTGTAVGSSGTILRTTTGGVTWVQDERRRPGQILLEQNYPNPFNPSTTIKYELPSSAIVNLAVYDLLGRNVSVLVNERKAAGIHEAKFNGSGLASGVYFYRLTAGDFVQTRKLLLVR